MPSLSTTSSAHLTLGSCEDDEVGAPRRWRVAEGMSAWDWVMVWEPEVGVAARVEVRGWLDIVTASIEKLCEIV